jgi:2-C-methyl-D-erythritol 4-phosphate cytidylyltransferase
MPTFAVILLCAGKSSRFGGGEKKVFADLDGRAVWLRSQAAFAHRNDLAATIVAVAPEDRERFREKFTAALAFMDNLIIVEGGAERADTVRAALAVVPSEADFVAVHDAARPCVSRDMVDRVFAAAVEHGAALLAAPCSDTIKRADAEGFAVGTVPREGLWLAQTPQVFRTELLRQAHAKAAELAEPATDDVRLVEAMGGRAKLVASDASNLKITTAGDLALAAAILRVRPDDRPRKLHPFSEENAW